MAVRVILLISNLLLFDAVQAGYRIRTFRGSEQSLLEGYSARELLDVAGKYGSSHIFQLTAPSQTVVSQQGVTIVLDCLPWRNMSQLHNGTIQWKYIQLDASGNPGLPTYMLAAF